MDSMLFALIKLMLTSIDQTQQYWFWDDVGSPYHQWVPSNKAITIKLVIGMLNLSWSHSASFSKLVQLYTELTGFIVFLKKLWSAKWIENVVEYQRVLEVSMLVKLYVSKESNFQGHFFLKSSKSHALIHWLT